MLICTRYVKSLLLYIYISNLSIILEGKNMQAKKLKLGLDLGTNSVGWALLDENNNLVKKNGFTFWGARMFNQAETAKKRRSYRCSGRRLHRRGERIQLLRQIFAEEINKVDPTFFERLDDSFYKIEDKRNLNYYTFFNDSITDKQYFQKFPTIYHLRYYLIKNNKQIDIRMLYLAIHNIIKYRGNFLMNGEEFKKSDRSIIIQSLDNINNAIDELATMFEEDDDFDADYFNKIDYSQADFFDKFEKIMTGAYKIKEKQKLLNELFNNPKQSIVKDSVVKLLSGGVCSFHLIKCVKHLKYDAFKIELNSENIDEKIEEGSSLITELVPLLNVVNDMKALFDHYYVLKIMADSNYYSEAMCKLYSEHQKDLKRLKAFVKTYIPTKYNECFRKVDEKLNNYVRYVGKNSTNGELKRFSHAKQNDFYNYLTKEIFDKVNDEDALNEKNYFLSKIETLTLLRRQNSNLNGAVPMQLHLAELKLILGKQAKYYSFLNENYDGLTNIEKIIAIFKYKLPFYVGPLNTKSPYSWVVRSNEKILPWNLNKVVNLDETAEKFIRRMQNKCTYLKGDNDYCLPKNSILFNEYNCLSYLNKIKINGSYINNDLKKEIFENVFLQKKTPTKKDIVNYLEANFGKNSVFGGEKGLPELNANMSSYVTFKSIFGDELDKNIDKIENIIKDITIFKDKNMLEKRLYKIYLLSEDKVKKIKGINYKGYSRLCYNLLAKINIYNPQTAESYGSVIDIMRKTNMNLQEILYHPDYRLIDRIDEYNKEFMTDENMSINEFIEENISVSPIIKRPIIQAIKIIDEIEKILNRKIDEYYVECSRTNKAKKTTQLSRYDKLIKLYNDLKLDDFSNLEELKSQLEKNKDNLKSDLLYLYFTQLGKCMYSLDNINIDDLVNSNSKYDIDHIYPQAIISDDSLNNRVLVRKDLNNSKQDLFLFETNIKNPKADKFYEMLLNKKLITAEKFRRLTLKELNNKELDRFVNRQIVATNQSVKGLIEVLKYYKKKNLDSIIYSKAENISDFRHHFDLVKTRTANNFHHAHDAYLNVVVGEVINNYFTKNRFSNVFNDYQRLKAEKKTINITKIFEKDILYVNGKLLWDKASMIKKIKFDLYQRYYVNETFCTTINHQMFNQVSVQPASNDNLIPTKTTGPQIDTLKYGGIKQQSYTKYVVVQTKNKKGEEQYILEAIPRCVLKSFEDDEINRSAIKNYISSMYDSFTIKNFNIFSNVIIEDDKKRYVITGKTNESYVIKNVLDRYFSYENLKIIKKIDKFIDQNKKNQVADIQPDYIIVSRAKNDKCSAIIVYKHELLNILDEFIKLFAKPIYNYSNISKINKALQDENEAIKQFDTRKLITLINELLTLLKTNERGTANLVDINLSSQAGTLMIGKVLKRGMKFIYQSATGYYKKILFEVK